MWTDFGDGRRKTLPHKFTLPIIADGWRVRNLGSGRTSAGMRA
jgi:hypothetical protein